MQSQRQQPTRLPCPWDSPGKNTGVGCHFLLQCMKVKSESEVARSCPTLRNPMDCSHTSMNLSWISIFTLISPLAIIFFPAWYSYILWGNVKWTQPEYSSHCICPRRSVWMCMLSLSASVQLFVTHGLFPSRILCPLDFPGKNTCVDYHFLLLEIFRTLGLNPHLLHLLTCIGMHILYHWATWEAPF